MISQKLYNEHTGFAVFAPITGTIRNMQLEVVLPDNQSAQGSILGKGDHEFWASPNGARFPVGDGMKSRHTANAVLKQAGIDYKIS